MGRPPSNKKKDMRYNRNPEGKRDRGGVRGRPPQFKTPEEMQEVVDEYFNSTPINQWTITGLALALKTSRTTLMNYKGKPEFVDIIKEATTKVEMSYELSLRVRGNAGDIFGLKNIGNWRDRQEVDQTTTAEITHKFEDMSDDELDEAIKAAKDTIS